jgi:hypothetical protein
MLGIEVRRRQGDLREISSKGLPCGLTAQHSDAAASRFRLGTIASGASGLRGRTNPLGVTVGEHGHLNARAKLVGMGERSLAGPLALLPALDDGHSNRVYLLRSRVASTRATKRS